jgi:methionyl-tRNA formyltransferase
MRVALLTTDMPHHVYFAWKLAEHFPLASIVVETRVLHAPFETFHPFEVDRDEYERDVLLAGAPGGLDQFAAVLQVENVNDAAAHIRELEPDVTLVFGTGRLSPDTIAVAPVCLNLHGGSPEEYRGLDTHLWAVYHRDFGALVTALHHVDLELDTGDLVGVRAVPLRRGMPLYELRSENTKVCVDLSAAALEQIDSAGPVSRRPQQRRGRYYSFMPVALKDVCVRQFERHTATL